MTYMSGFSTRIFLVLLLLPTVLYSSDLYILRNDEGDYLVKIDTNTFSTETIGALDFSTSSTGMAWHPRYGKLLVARINPSSIEKNPDFYFVDPKNAESEYLGSINLGVSTGARAAGLAIDPNSGSVYLGHMRSIFEIDLENLTATEIGRIPGETHPAISEDLVSLDSLTFDSKNNRLLSASSNLDVDPKIFSINPETGDISHFCTIVLPEGYSTFNDDWQGFHSGGIAYDSDRDVYWRVGRFEPLLELVTGEECHYTVHEEVAITAEAVSFGPMFSINPGMNDAWYDPATNGQGFLITVFPEIQQMFLAWFTYDTERPPQDTNAVLGEPGHRWLTAQGPYSGDTGSLSIYMTEGGVFDAADPPATNDGIADGTLTIEFADCTEGLVTYEMTSPSVSGQIPIQRITDDNVALCETLSGQ